MIKKIIEAFKNFLKNLALKERCPKKLALSFCMGVYIAFSPFPGLHTAMVFAFSWLFRLNWAVVLSSSCLINSPWTMVPIYATDYMVGNWLCGQMFGCDMLTYNPSWMNWINQHVSHYAGMGNICLSSFLIGGNVLGVGFALLLYVPMKYLFGALVDQMYNRAKPTVSL